MKNNKTFVVADIHGQHKALMQCLERSGFDYENDKLISLGDVVDRGRDSYLVVEELLKIKNFIGVKGNHDQVFQHWLNTGVHQFGWGHGGEETRISYKLKGESWDKLDELGKFNLMISEVPQSHRDFFKNQVEYYIDSKNRLFIHGGFDVEYPLIEQDINTFAWDRKLWNKALSCKGKQKIVTLEDFSKIYIGHIPTTDWTEIINDKFGNKKIVEITHPMHSGDVWNLDTGAGYSFGKLSMMNVNTQEIFQSDLIETIC